MNTVRKKNIISLFLCLCCLSGLLASCGGTETSQRPTTESTLTESASKSEETPVTPSCIESESITTTEPIEPTETPKTEKEYSEMTDIELSRYAAAEGMVLLKNDNEALPLKKGEKIAVFGSAQINFIKGGTGSGDVNALYLVNALEGLENKEAEGKIGICKALANKYKKNSAVVLKESDYADAAKECKTALVILSRNSGENVDVSQTMYNLTSQEKTIFNRIKSAGFEKVVAVLNIGTVMDSTWLRDESGADALLISWQPGMEGGNALADVLCGDVTPSGKLADTMASSYKDYPASSSFMSAPYAVYTEDIYVGYRYFETFDKEYKKVNYEFGYGLSYTDFELSTPEVECDGRYIQIKVNVKNVGKYSGKETVQVYFSSPEGKLGTPGKVLAAFEKTGLLAPGESETLTLTYAVEDMASYDDLEGKVAQSAYVLQKGDYNVYVGNSVKDAGKRGAVYTFKVESDTVTKQLSAHLTPNVLEKRLTSDGSYETLPTNVSGIRLYDGKTVIDGTDYLIQHSDAHIASNADGSVYGMNLSSGKTLVYSVYSEKGGTYILSLLTAQSSSGSAALTLNGKSAGTCSLSSTGGVYTKRKQQCATLELKQGTNELKIEAKSGFLLCAVIFDDGNEGYTDLCKGSPVSYTPSGESITFLDVYNDESKMDAFIDSLTLFEMADLLCGHTPNVAHGDGSLAGLTSKGVPYLDTSDGPAGLDLAEKQVAWPIETSLACTWNKELLYAVGVKIGEECLNAGVDVWLAPGINIHRDPLGGRNFEYFSEDPLLTGKISAALTKGVQSSGKVGVMLKHLYANSREAGRVDGDSIISERASREVYLKAFEICVKEAQPWAIMTTYNSANGIYNSENTELLTDILRGEWGFEGFVCTDWGAHSEQFREIIAGNDAKMSWGYPDSIVAGVRAGIVPLENLKESAKRLLTAALHSGSMDRKLHPKQYSHVVNGNTRIKAIEYNEKSDGIGSEGCEDEGGGIIPNYTQDNRYLIYSLDVKKAGTYQFTFRAASSNTNSSVRIFIDGEQIGVFRWPRGSKGWQNWETLTSGVKATLTEGTHELKFVFITAMNLNWFELNET